MQHLLPLQAALPGLARLDVEQEQHLLHLLGDARWMAKEQWLDEEKAERRPVAACTLREESGVGVALGAAPPRTCKPRCALHKDLLQPHSHLSMWLSSHLRSSQRRLGGRFISGKRAFFHALR